MRELPSARLNCVVNKHYYHGILRKINIKTPFWTILHDMFERALIFERAY